MRKVFFYFIMTLLILIQVGCKSSAIDNREITVNVYTTLGDRSKLLEKQEDIILKQTVTGTPQTVISLDDTVLYQEMDGFGAALTESSAYLINNLEASTREKVINDLFSKDGIGMSFVRLPIGSSDFALSSYTYDDISVGEIDTNLEQFTIERDKNHVIPVLKDAFALNQDIKLIGSPWSAPAWMKTNKNLNGGSLKEDYLDVYANYFVRFIKAYEEEGIPIYAITPQNEPLHETSNYPSMKMDANQQIRFIKKLASNFSTNDIQTKIIAYDHNWDQTLYPMTILNDQSVSQVVSGTAFHCYAGDVNSQNKISNAFENKGIWFTECSGGRWANNFSDNMSWNMENVFIGSINNFSKSVLLWNIALDENDGPQNGGCTNCRGVLTIKSDGTIIKNEEYFMIGHFSKFVQPGANRIKATVNGNNNVLSTAFKNQNGDIVIVVHNKSSKISIQIQYDGLKMNYILPTKSTNTFIIDL